MHRPCTRPLANCDYLSVSDTHDRSIYLKPRQNDWKWSPFADSLRLDPKHSPGKNHSGHAGHLPPARAKNTRRRGLIRNLGNAEGRKTHYPPRKEPSERSHVIPFLKGMGPGVVLEWDQTSAFKAEKMCGPSLWICDESFYKSQCCLRRQVQVLATR